MNKLTTHLKRSPQEQQNIAKIYATNDQMFASQGGLFQSDIESENPQMAKPPQALNESMDSQNSLVSRKTGASIASSTTQPQQVQLQIKDELFDADDDMFGRSFQPG